MSPLPFRFGILAVPQAGADHWRATARRAEELGFATILVPDGTNLLSPLPALAVAAGATSTLHVGSWVFASPLRPPRLLAWDAHSLSVLSGGRFEFGIGTGRPEVVDQSVQLLGHARPTAAQRLALAGQAIDALRELDGDLRTPVLMAAAGPKAMQLAAAKADIVTLATGQETSREQVAAMAARLRELAGSRASSIEIAMSLFVVGDEAPKWLEHAMGVQAADLVRRDSLLILRGSVPEMADELRRRRDTAGISYVVVNAAYTEQLAPVVERLAGS